VFIADVYIGYYGKCSLFFHVKIAGVTYFVIQCTILLLGNMKTERYKQFWLCARKSGVFQQMNSTLENKKNTISFRWISSKLFPKL